MAGSFRVFSAEDENVSCFRIPAVVRTLSGTLLAFAEARHGSCEDHRVHEIVLRRSTDGGATWEPQQVVIGNVNYHVANPQPIVEASGRVVMVYCALQAHSTSPVSNGFVVSEDDGRSWSSGHSIDLFIGRARASSPGPGPGIEVRAAPPAGAAAGGGGPKGGRRLVSVLHHGAYVEDFVIYSDDAGDSWNTVNQSFPFMDEGALADLGDGQVLLNMRHRDEPSKGRAVARSSDGGLSWSPISFDPVLVGPVCQGSLVAFDGSVYFSNPASPAQRANLTVRRSDDGGVTWKASYVIQPGASWGYSSLVPSALTDGLHGGILYEAASMGSIDFATFPLDLGSPGIWAPKPRAAGTSTTLFTSTSSSGTRADEEEAMVQGISFTNDSEIVAVEDSSEHLPTVLNASGPDYVMLQTSITEDKRGGVEALILWATVLLMGLSGVFCGAGCREFERVRDDLPRQRQQQHQHRAEEKRELLVVGLGAPAVSPA